MTRDDKQHHQQGIAAFRIGDYEEAQSHFQVAIESARTAQNRKGEAEALNDLGVIEKELGNLEQAFENLQIALDIYDDLEDTHGKGVTLGNLGKVEEAAGKYKEAIQSYIEAAATFETLNEAEMAMYCWQALSRLKMRQKDWVGAIAAYEEGIAHLPDSSVKKKMMQKLLQLPTKFIGRA